MNQYEARQQFIEGLERYVSGIENDDGLTRIADHVSKYHDRMPSDAYDGERNRVAASAVYEHLRERLRGPSGAISPVLTPRQVSNPTLDLAGK